MSQQPHRERQQERKQELVTTVSDKARRKQRARRSRDRSLWFGLGAIGVIGWTVGLFTLAGIFLGLWLDANRPQAFSWTLTLLLTGLFLGCLSAGYWLAEEWQAIKRSREE